MVSSLLLAIATQLLRVWSWIACPDTVTCPVGWYAHGVRPSGHTECVLVSPDSNECFGSNPCTSGPEMPAIPVRVWRSSDERPIALNDGRTVTCARRYGA